MSGPLTPGGTATTHGARDHARAQAEGTAEAMPHLPPSRWPGALPDGVEADALTWAETIAGGGYASLVVARGTTLRLADVSGEACAHVLLFSALGTWERLNVADTVKIPWQAYLGAGHPLLSDQGRVLATITADTSGAHDALCGTTSKAVCDARYGDGSPQSGTPAGRELLILAAAKQGLSPRDVAPSVSFFKGVRVQDGGTLAYAGGVGAGTHVELRAELPLVVLVANVPHPLDERPQYTCGTLELLAWPGEPTPPEDPLCADAPEYARALRNTIAHATARGL